MDYSAFALKYRPQNFDEVVGQKHIVSSLKNAILRKRVHHAYLFSGPRGVGKTSLARIFAKALNCENGPTVTPCGKCINCTSITKGNSLDVIEIDGASNRGIDEIRSLRESVKLSSSGARYKIYIIDEVHMLTQEAFNALLKTLEEPPSHVKFIFATTHPQKVLPTILSRCQKFQFKLLTFEEIVSKLERIIKEEHLKIDKDILHSIARSADGSIRDAESLLDQIVPIVLEKGDVKDIISFLGIIDETTLNEMLTFIAERDIEKSLDFIHRITQEGKDLGIFLNSFIEHLRSVLLSKVSKKAFKEMREVSPYTKEFIVEKAEAFTTFDILKLIDLLIEAKGLSKKLNSIRIPLELAVVKFITNFTVVYFDSSKSEAAKQVFSTSSGLSNKTVNQEKPRYVKNTNISSESHFQKDKKQSSPEKNKKGISLELTSGEDFDIDVDDIAWEEKNQALPRDIASEKEEISLTIDDISRKWPSVISEISKRRVSLASYLKEASLYSLKGRILTLSFSPRHSFYKEAVESLKNTKFIESYLADAFGYRLGIKCILLKDEENSAETKEPEHIEDTKDDGFINELLDTFGGNIHTDGE